MEFRYSRYYVLSSKTLGWPEEELWLDHGFRKYSRLNDVRRRKLKEGQIIRVRNGSMKLVEGGTKKDLYTYRAYVSRVIDGDTFWAVLDLNLGARTRQKIRLRGVDTPELGTRKGKKVLEFVKKILPPTSFFILYSSRSEKFDRYLGDVFVPVHDQGRDLLKNSTPPRTQSKIQTP